ncbi:MAG: hypothetical protein AAF456_18765 [Planctomycetota bacterium]
MRFATALDIATLCIRHPGVLLGRKKYLFLFSHMRSYSSLLAHILGSNPGINGHSERLRPYRNKRDLLRLRLTDYRETRETGHEFLLDKILHNQYRVEEQILELPSLRPVFFLRPPGETYQSIHNMGRNILKDEAYCDLDAIHSYYRERLDELVRYSSIVADRAIYFDAAMLVDQPDELLGQLSTWLSLQTPLQKQFTVFEDTGQNLKGDPSGNLQSGEIRKTEGRERIEIPAAMLAEADAHYHQCRERLMNNCRTIVAG